MTLAIRKLKNKKIVPSGLLNIRNVPLFVFLLLILLKYILTITFTFNA